MIGATQSQLFESLQRLRQRWQDTTAVWNDPVSQNFEKEYWTPLENQAQAMLKEMERLAQVIAQAKRNLK